VDGPAEGARSSDEPDATTAPAAAAADDVSEAALADLRQRLGCTREGPALPGSQGVACGLLGRFASGRAPTWEAGSFPGVVLAPAVDRPDISRPALLAVRGSRASTEVAWGAISPDDPRHATDLSAMAADVLEGSTPHMPLAPWPGLVWSRPRATRGPPAAEGRWGGARGPPAAEGRWGGARGTSAQIGTEPGIFARSEDGATIVVVWDEEAPLVALHRAPAAAP
jgi:hypothetical protein